MAISSPTLRMWGRFEHSLDDKGRVIVPAKFRDKLGKEFVLTIGPGHHIRVYPIPTWEFMEEQLVSASVHDENDPNLVFLQRMYGNCEFAEPDQNNRVTIPRHLRDWANVRETETAIIVGNGSRVEIWSRTGWETYSNGFTEEKAAQAAAARQFRTYSGEPTTTNREARTEAQPDMLNM